MQEAITNTEKSGVTQWREIRVASMVCPLINSDNNRRSTHYAMTLALTGLCVLFPFARTQTMALQFIF